MSTTRSGRLTALQAFVARHAADVVYVRQLHRWDCGLACLEMALRARGIEEGTSSAELRRLCKSDSVWTIDLAYILRHFGVDSSFSTLTLGARAEYGEQPFYRQHFPEDAKRVTDLFRRSAERGVTVLERSVRLSEIVQAVREGVLVLVLLDKRLLWCQLCEGAAPASGDEGAAFLQSRFRSVGFLGHYVMLYAYDDRLDGGAFLAKDPASLRDACVIHSNTLEAARTAFGTDEDIIFIGQRKTPSIVT